MAHEVESMMYAGELPWHALGSKLEDHETRDTATAIVRAGLNWRVNLIDLVTADEARTPVTMKAVRRDSDGRVLGVVGQRYTPLQNEDAFKWFQPFLDAEEATLESAGSLREGSRVWVMAKLNRKSAEVVPGDKIDKYLLLSHGHDGTLAVRCGFTPVRVVCANTLAMAHEDGASKLIRVKHSASVLTSLAAVRETINVANEAFEATAEQYRKLAQKSINQDDVRKYVHRVFGVDAEQETSTRMKNILAAVIDLQDTGIGNDIDGVKGTLWASYNAVTQYLSHVRGNNVDNRTDSLWFGPSQNLNNHALQIALEMAS